MSEKDKSAFSTQNPLLLHWDGKLMPAIDDGMETVDRVAILVSGGGGVEKLLAVAKMQSGTGEAQSTACLRALEDWKLKAHVARFSFRYNGVQYGTERWSMHANRLSI